jgi:hypothetical protein
VPARLSSRRLGLHARPGAHERRSQRGTLIPAAALVCSCREPHVARVPRVIWQESVRHGRCAHKQGRNPCALLKSPVNDCGAHIRAMTGASRAMTIYTWHLGEPGTEQIRYRALAMIWTTCPLWTPRQRYHVAHKHVSNSI